MEVNKQRSTVRSSATEAIIDQGLRSYMLKVYNYMASGGLLTGFVALLFFKMAVVTSAEVTTAILKKSNAMNPVSKTPEAM